MASTSDGGVSTPERKTSRREFLTAGVGLGAAAIAASAIGSSIPAAAAARSGSLADIEHVVLLMMENRSFDHYFGTMSGVRGFSDPTMIRQADGLSILYQPDVDLAQNASLRPYVLPWHLDSKTTSAQYAQELGPVWSLQHLSWNEGLMDGFVTSHRIGDDFFEYIGVPIT